MLVIASPGPVLQNSLMKIIFQHNTARAYYSIMINKLSVLTANIGAGAIINCVHCEAQLKLKWFFSFILRKKIIVNTMLLLKGLLPIAGHYEQNWEMTPLFSRKSMIFIRTLSTFSQNIWEETD